MHEQFPAAGGTEGRRGEALAARLSAYSGPAHRKAYLSGLLDHGLRFLGSASVRSACYCLDKVESELDSGVDPGSPAVARAATPSALDGLRARWREEKARGAETVLERHGYRLSPLERKAYREGLARWRATAAAPAGAGRADSALGELRRKLYGRILMAQKAELAGRAGMPALPFSGAKAHGPVGPYNDRHNLEGLVGLLGQADRAWVEEFLGLYGRLSGLQGLLAPPAVQR